MIITHETLILILQILFGICLVLGIVILICWGMIFRKASEKGWKVLIPFCNDYVAYRITWSATAFLVRLLTAVIACFLFLLSGSYLYNRIAVFFSALRLPLPAVSFDWFPFILPGKLPARGALLSCIFIAAGLIMDTIRLYKLSKAFGHGFPFFLGLLFFPAVFLSILAFGSRSRYVGLNESIRTEELQDLR